MALLNNLRREWKTYLSQRLWILCALLLTLCALALIQYHWIDQLAHAELQRAKTNLTTALFNFESEFDIEITRVFAAFQLPQANPADYSERYKEWLRRAPDPGLIRGVYILETKKTGPLVTAVTAGEPAIRSNEWQKTLSSLALPFGMAIVSAPAGSEGFQLTSQSGIIGFSGSANLDVIIDGNPAFIFPVVSAMDRITTQSLNRIRGVAPRLGSIEIGRVAGPLPPSQWAVVVLEARFIERTLVPRLLKVHFPNGSASDYDFLILRRTGSTASQTVFRSESAPPESKFGQPDGRINLYALRPDCFVPSSLSDTGPQSRSVRVAGIGPQPHVLSSADRLSEILAATSPSCNNVAPPTGGRSTGAWEMLVRYRAGSLDQTMAAFRHRSILLSCSVLLVLALGILMLVVLTERARSLAEMQTEFVLGVSHELRTPLTVIRVAADNLREGMVENSGQAQNYGEIIGSHASELSNMIEEALAFARAQSATFLGERTLVAPAQIAEASVAHSETALHHAGIQVEHHLASDLPLVDVDVRLLNRCLENLIQNVVKYAAVGRWMAIRVYAVSRPEGERVKISVEDRGPGISPIDLPHVFEPFYRGKQVEASQVPGVGLGLTLVRRVVEAHGGTVEVESSGTTGTIFSIYLPVRRAQSGSQKEA